MKGEIHKFTIIIRDFNTLLSTTGNKEIENYQPTGLTDIFRIHHSKTIEYTLFSSAYGNFTKIDYILAVKTSLSKCKLPKSHKVCSLTKME